MKIVLATGNKDKLKEFREILNCEIVSLSDIGFFEDIEETGETFEENALIKARAVKSFLKEKGEKFVDCLVVADDSGLCVDALNGAPGVKSARYSGEQCNYQANREKLLREMKGIKNRNAEFVCNIAVIYPDDTQKIFVGKSQGTILEEEKGNNGFGYDPVFYSLDLNKTFSQATKEEKNSVSHRGRALQEMKKAFNLN